jgi:predicted choloylglycine hydrolase
MNESGAFIRLALAFLAAQDNKWSLGVLARYVMEPLFFSSIGFAIPFLKLWTGERIWKGIVYTLLMTKGMNESGAFIRLALAFLAAQDNKWSLGVLARYVCC